MRITSIEPQKNKNRVNIFVDNVFSIGIDEELRFKYGLKVDMEIDDDFIKDILEAEEHLKAFLPSCITALTIIKAGFKRILYS